MTSTHFGASSHPDLPSTFVHFTGRPRTDIDPRPSWAARDPEGRLVEILQSGRIRARNAFGTSGAVICVSEPTDQALQVMLSTGTTWRGRYAPWGLIISRAFAIERGFRPVLHVSDDDWRDVRNVSVKATFRDRRVRYEPENGIDWLHEREWRLCFGVMDTDPSIPGFDLAGLVVGVITGKPDWYPPPVVTRLHGAATHLAYAAACNGLPRFWWNGDSLQPDGAFDVSRRIHEDVMRDSM